MDKIISINEWKRPMRSLDEAEKIPNLIIPNPTNSNKSTKDDKQIPQLLYDLRRAAECHKIVRRNVQGIIKPGIKILDICNYIENNIKEIFGKNDLKAGVAFPTGVSLNNVICHDTANINDTRIIGKDDICKIDMGCHVNGMIIDSAFSVAFNPQYEPILEASKQATLKGMQLSGPDAYIYDISKEIKEILNSYEAMINNKVYSIIGIGDIGGHNLERYIIHAGKLVLCAPYESKEYKSQRMLENEQFAIETFASTGTGKMVKSTKQSNHYMLNKDNLRPYKGKLKTINNVYNWVKKNRSTLAFCPRWLEDEKMKGINLSLNELARKSNPPIIVEYPPLEDIEGSLVSHYEHTIFITENGKEILSHGDDY